MAGPACQACGAANPSEAKFCMTCGSPLESRCPSCGSIPQAGARFCMDCGTPLQADATRKAMPEERRNVTVLFADLAGYTAVAERMDPEDLKALVGRCLRRLGEEVVRFGGTVDKYIGDNVMAIFGAPVAHEDDPERAVRAALAMQEAMAEMNQASDASDAVALELRVGVNTGAVVAGAMGDAYTVVGDTVNVAARLESAGRPGKVTVGERTYRATREAIAYTELAPLRLKGKADAVLAWEAGGVLTATASKRQAAPGGTPLVGRDDELDLLQRVYARTVRENRPHLVTVIGQAGVGKSRLLSELASTLKAHETPPTVLEGRCLPYGSSIVYWALTEIIHTECEILDSDPSELAWRKLSSGLETLLRRNTVDGDESTERKVALIGRLLGFEVADDASAGDLDDPAALREAFFSAVRSVTEAMAKRQPLVLVFEDIHWADAGMLDLIEYLAQWVHGPLLLLCLARDELLELRPNWGSGRRNATSILLEPLTAEDTGELVRALLPAGADADEVVSLVGGRAGGNPFFVEEMVRHVLEEGGAEQVQLPDTVQALLAARLDGLEPFERSLVQQAAVFGSTFWESSLVSLAEDEGQDLAAALGALQTKDIIVGSSGGLGGQVVGEREFAFRHVLIRDVAYGMLPRSIRCAKHHEVGRFIEDRAGDRTDEVVALLAEHYGRAAVLGQGTRHDPAQLEDIHAKALRFLEAAGDAAASLYSNPEAFDHYQAARELRPPPEPEALARVCEKQGDVAVHMARVEAAVAAWQLCLDHYTSKDDLRRVGDLHRKIGAALWDKGERKQATVRYQQGINLLKDQEPCLELVRLYEEAASLYMHTGDNMLAIYAAERALRLAEQLHETRAASRAHGIFGRVFGRIGDAAKARENLERSVDLARGADPTETIRALLTLGYHLEVSDAAYDEAGRVYAEALQLAEQVGDLPSQVELQAALALLAVYRADWAETQARTEASVDLAEREGLVGKLCFPYGVRGLLRWREGDWDDSERWFRRAAELAEQVGWSEIAFSSQLGLALTLRDGGDTQGAVEALDRALAVCERAGLVAQSIQATAQRAVVLALDGQPEAAREVAQEAMQLAQRLSYPAGQAASAEAEGVTALNVREGADTLAKAEALWRDLGRPLDATRCKLLAGWLRRNEDPAAAHAAMSEAAQEFRKYGAPHALGPTRALIAG